MEVNIQFCLSYEIFALDIQPSTVFVGQYFPDGTGYVSNPQQYFSTKSSSSSNVSSSKLFYFFPVSLFFCFFFLLKIMFVTSICKLYQYFLLGSAVGIAVTMLILGVIFTVVGIFVYLRKTNKRLQDIRLRASD